MVQAPQFDYLDSLPPPNSVVEVAYQTVLDNLLQRIANILPGWAAAEDDPFYKLAEEIAYLLYLATQDTNGKLRSSYRKYAQGGDLRNLAALIGLEEIAGETDEELGRRFDIALIGNAPGTLAGIQADALAAGIGVDDVQSIVSANGQTVTVYTAKERAPLTATEQAALLTFLTLPGKVHLGDILQLGAVTTRSYTVEATISYDSRDTDVTSLEALLRTAIYERVNALAKLGGAITVFRLRSAMDVEGVENAAMTAPAADTAGVDGQIPTCDNDATGVILTFSDLAP